MNNSELSTLSIMESIQDAVKIIGEKRRSVSDGSAPVWAKLEHASNYLDKEMKSLLAEGDLACAGIPVEVSRG